MTEFLVLRLDGVMQAWGDHTYEDFRPVAGFPTRSGLLGLLAACLGIDRADTARLMQLDASVDFTVRVDGQRQRNSEFFKRIGRDGDSKEKLLKPQKIMDFHTVMAARKVTGKANDNPVVSRREYVCDAVFTVVVAARSQEVSLEQIKQAVLKPVFTPFLGRRSCPLSRPLFLAWEAEVQTPVEVLAKHLPVAGRIYSDAGLVDDQGTVQIRMRDIPIRGKTRRFASRQITLQQEAKDVFK